MSQPPSDDPQPQTPRRRAPQRTPYNDLDLDRWREYEEVETDSLWIIPNRARGNGHNLDYHGNFVPQIATQALLRYTRQRDTVVDLFHGSGTTAIEALRLGRRCVGVELKPELVEYVREKLPAGTADVQLVQGDSRASETVAAVREALRAWEQDHAQLVMLHPPYADIITFSDRPECLSNVSDFVSAFREVAANAYELLEPRRFAVLVIGDKYAEGEWVPLGFQCMEQMQQVGFRLKSIVVKNIEGNEVGKGRDSNLWRYRALAGGFYVFKHEYVMIFQKPQRRATRTP